MLTEERGRSAVPKHVRGGGETKVEDDGSINGEGIGHVLGRWWFLPSKQACWARLPGANLRASGGGTTARASLGQFSQDTRPSVFHTH